MEGRHVAAVAVITHRHLFIRPPFFSFLSTCISIDTGDGCLLVSLTPNENFEN